MRNDNHTSMPAGTFLIDQSQAGKWRSYGRYLPGLVLMVALIATYLLWHIQEQAVEKNARDYFDFRVNDAVEKTESRLHLYQEALRGTQALFDASGSIGRHEFGKYVASLNLGSTYPGIQGIGFSLRIPPQELQSHIASIRRQGFSDYTVKPAGARESYTSIVYLEPFDWRNRRAFGYDMYSEPVRRQAMDAARDSGQAAMSGKVELVQETGRDVQSGFLLYFPVYRGGAPHATLAERRANLTGWVYAPFRMGDLMRGIFGERASELDIRFYDGNEMSGQTLLYESGSRHNPDPHFLSVRHLDIAGHAWSMQIASQPSMEARLNTSQPHWIAAGGSAVSLLLALITWLTINGRRRAIQIAVDLNQSLIDSREALQQENEKNLALLRNASDGIHILDAEGNVIEASDSFCSMLGYRRDEVIGMNVLQWDAGFEDAAQLHATLKKQFDHPVRTQFETRHRRRDGTIFEVEVSGFPLMLGGKPVLFNSSRDITERKQLQRHLQDERDFVAAILQSAGPLILVIDRHGSIVRFNRAAEEFTGYRFDEVRDKPFFWRRFLPPWQQAGVETVFESALAGQITTNYENFWMHRDGKVRLFNWTNALILDGSGKASFLIAIGNDITEKRKAEDLVIENEQRLLEILNLSPIAVRIASRQARKVLFCNAGYAELIRNPDAIGDDPGKYYAREDEYDEILAELSRGKPIINREVQLHIPGSGSVWTLASYMPIRYRGEDAVLGWFYDITERKLYTVRLFQSEMEYRHLIELLPYGVLIHRDGKVLFANQTAATLLRAGESENLIGIQVLQLVHPDYRNIVMQRARAAIDQGENSAVIEEKLVRLDGSVFYAEVGAISVLFENQPASLAVFVDVTQRKQNEDELRLAASVYRSSSEGMLITDAESRIVAINPAFTQLTGYTADDVIGQTPRILKSGLQSKEFYQDMWAQLQAAGHWRGELWNRRKDGNVYAEHLTINVEKRDDGSVHRYVALFSDVTEQKKKEEQIWRHANFDTLTGLPNRRLFYDRLEQEVKKSSRTAASLGLLFIDLDRFKEVNDTLGHAKGDALLIEATRRIRKHIRETDTLARLGGDEFTVILPAYAETANIDRIVQNILRELCSPFDLGEGDFGHVSASVGITLYPEDAGNLEELLQHADQAMYAAKDAGRNGFSYFTASLQQEAQEKMHLTNDLRQALGRNELAVFYQPIVEAGSGRIIKAEALLRWNHPTRGLIGPATFVPLAEESGLILEIGEWVFLEAIGAIQQWQRRTGLLVQVSVNKSPIQFVRGEQHPWLERLAHSGLPASSIAVEITEGLLITDSAKVRNELVEFKKQGIEVSIDDFGTGFSALSYLTQFDIDYLKIDRSFVKDINEVESSRALTEAIVVMAHKLGIKTIAEGVETEAQRDRLIGLGCDYLQGYLYSHAVPPAEFEKLLLR